MNEEAVRHLAAQLRSGKGVTAHRYGGQLRRLHEALCDPLQQEIGIVFLGDSITWGSRLAGGARQHPRSHSLSDARDFFSTPSWVNEFKRAIGREYFSGAAPIISNWPSSPSGESTVEYRHSVDLYPGLPPFKITSAAAREVECKDARLGYLLQFVNEGEDVCPALSFYFTGTTFTLIFSSTLANQSMNYELIIAGLSHGIFATRDSELEIRNGLSRVHTFPYVRQQKIEIRPLRVNLNGAEYLELEAIRVEKKCVVTNQGIIGSDVRTLIDKIPGTGRPDALTYLDNFVVIQFGANDRSNYFSKYKQANGVNNFSRNIITLIDRLCAHADVILMAPGPVADEAPPRYAFSMLDARNALNMLAQHSGLDLIDNFAALQGMDLLDILADGLHPNELGHALIARNLLDALRTA